VAIESLHHIGIYTKSVDESLAFYTEILEFKKQWRGIVDHPTGKLDVAIISIGDCVIELVRPADLSVITPKAGPIQHVALKVSHIEEHVEKLERSGIELHPSKIEFLPTLLNGVKHVFLYGPSGERIELAEEYDAGNAISLKESSKDPHKQKGG
jgi:catechol 2,3-dioxygenase-like lactoylglutathione lyase family enzyme